MMRKVFFNLRKSSRERMWDTAREACRVCEPLTPGIEQRTSLARADAKKQRTSILKQCKRVIFRFLPLINYQAVSGAGSADLLYMWGAFPTHSKKPFVIELDNPFVLTYYKKLVFRLWHHALKQKLRRARYITHLSETAKNHTLELFGNEFSEKCRVLPPFMERNYLSNRRAADGTIRFLFVGLGFRRKGGPELLDAFSRLPHQNARLMVVAPVEETHVKKYESDSRIEFLPPQPREVLLNELYPTHDIFVFPSLLETLGVVVLEALSYGMGIITTDLYATPEMVKDGYNGRLLPHPFLTHTSLNGVSVIDCVTPERKALEAVYSQTDMYEGLANQVLIAMQAAMTNAKAWQEQSVQLFEEKFAPEVWEKRFREIVKV